MNEIEEQAKKQGWNPDFKGANAKTAEQFMEDGKNIAPIAAERNQKLLEEVEALKQSNLTLTNDMKGFLKDQHKRIHASEKRGYDKAIKEIEKKQLTAVEEGDTEEFKALEKEKKGLEKPKAPTTKTDTPKQNPELIKWHKNNPWFKIDSKGTAVDAISAAAISYDIYLNSARPDLQGVDALKEVEKHIKLTFPGQFKAPDSKLDTSSHNSNNSGGKGYKGLSKEEKAACDSQVTKGYCTQEEWVKSYEEAYNG